MPAPTGGTTPADICGGPQPSGLPVRVRNAGIRAQADAPRHRSAEDQSRHDERDSIPTATRCSRDRRARWSDRVLSVLSAASASATGVLKRYERGGNGLGAGSGALLKGLCGPRS
jgi:hypothetical protein